MTEQAAELYKQPPYIIAVIKGKQELLYFGSEHANDTKHPQYPLLARYWAEFLTESEGLDKVALVEGGERNLKKSLKATIEFNGEAGWLTWHAHKAGIECRSPEPDDKEHTRELVDIYGEDAVMHYYFMRDVNQWQRYGQPDGYEEYFWFVKEWQKIYGFIGKVTLASLERIHRDITGKDFDKDDQELSYELGNPYESLAVTNAVSAASSRLRDLHIAGELQRYWNEGKSIFAVYGHSHVVEQEPLLRQRLT